MRACVRACVRTRRCAYLTRSARTCTCMSSHLHSCAGTCRASLCTCVHAQTCTCTSMHKHACHQPARARTCMCVCACARTIMRVHVCAFTSACVQEHAHAHSCTNVHVFERTCTSTRAHMLLMQMRASEFTRPCSAASLINKLISLPGRPL